MKTCFKCGQEKPLSEFYRHPRMADGHLGKCKTCAKADVAARIDRKKSDADWLNQEAERCRKKQRIAREIGTAIILRGEKRAAVLKNNQLKYPQKHEARIALRNAVRDGSVKRLPCEVCGSTDSEGHHDNYSRPLDVKWLCPKHHAERHVQLNNERRRIRALERQSLIAV